MDTKITVTSVYVSVTVTREYTWEGDPSTIPTTVVGDWRPDGHEDEDDAREALYGALDAPIDPVALIDWITSTMDLDDETITIDEVS